MRKIFNVLIVAIAFIGLNATIASSLTSWDGGGGSQTPWTSNIDGGGFNLTNVGSLSVGDIYTQSQETSVNTVIGVWEDTSATQGVVMKAQSADSSIVQFGVAANTDAVNPTIQSGLVMTTTQLSFLTSSGEMYTMDSTQGFYPTSSNTSDLGLSVRTWKDLHIAGNAFFGGDLEVDEVQFADQGTKGTCDAAKAGTVAYEVVTNVGTFYGCRQTAASTFAWTALH